MNKELTLIGGVRVGLLNVTFPFVRLYVDEHILTIKGFIVGDLAFKPEDIISIEPYFSIPIIGNGIKINHTIKEYNSKVIFWVFKDPNSVILEIKKTGFLHASDDKE